MTAKLIVTGLGEEIRDEDIYDLFDVYGLIVDVGVHARPEEVMGYVVYDDALSALRARLGMDGAEVNGRRIGVRPVVPYQGRPEPPAVPPDPEWLRWLVHPK